VQSGNLADGAEAVVFEVTPDNAREYLLLHGYIAVDSQAVIEPLGWGISNVVMKVTVPGDSEDCFVFKQSLPKLRVKDDWPFARERIFVERRCMELLGELLPPGSVPSVRFHDDENFVFGMSCAPGNGVLWEKALLDGEIDLVPPQQVGALLAEIHNRTANDSRTKTEFANEKVFIEGRVDPYHWTTAKAHPDLAPIIEAEVQRMLNTHLTLVHGDYSPKNMFVYPDNVLILDFEVSHYGDPAFDAAFCLNHLILPAIRFPERSSRYLKSAQIFWQAYSQHLTPVLDPQIEATTIRELGCLMLARIDGKSKIPYITDEPTRNITRGIAREILLGSETSLETVLARIGQRIATSQEQT
jgi:5-methylthioribose kinase